jgi:hypothetical protein
MSFWWEDGYVNNDNKFDKQAKMSRRAIDIDDGKVFLSDFIPNTSNCLQCTIDHENRYIITLCDRGKSFSTVSIHSISNPQLLRSVNVDDKCGYFNISRDSTLFAIGVLKEDKTLIIDFETEDLLINLKGNHKNGYFGQLVFMDDRNLLLELRVVASDNRGPKKSVCRLWHLGFNNNKESNDVENSSEEDELETVLWQFESNGGGFISYNLNSIYIVWEHDRKLESVDFHSGKILLSINHDKWLAKCIHAKKTNLIAVSHFGMCSIVDTISFKNICILYSPIQDDKYPLVPVSFIYNDEYIVCRINYDMTLIIYCIKSPSMMFTVQGIGGTISDVCLVSPNTDKLLCWPYDNIEIYNLNSIVNLFEKKISKLTKYEIVLLRELVIKNRAEVVGLRNLNLVGELVCDSTSLICVHKLINITNINILRVVLSFIP